MNKQKYIIYTDPNSLSHHGVKGMHWGIRKDRYDTSTSIKSRNENNPYKQAKKQKFKDYQDYLEKQRGLNRELLEFNNRNKKGLKSLSKEKEKIINSKKKEYYNNYYNDTKSSYDKVNKHGKLMPYETGQDYVKNFINKKGDIVTYDDINRAADHKLVKIVRNYEKPGQVFNNTLSNLETKQRLYRIDSEADNYAKNSKEYKDWQKRATSLSNEEIRIRNKYR